MIRNSLTAKQRRFYSMTIKERIKTIRQLKAKGKSLYYISKRYGVRQKTIAKVWGSKLKLVKGKKKRMSGDNILVTLYFKLEDYGDTGHRLWINCWRKQIFAGTVEESTIDKWIHKEKDMLLEDNLTWFGRWVYSVDYEWGEEREATTLPPGILDGKNTYSHDGVTWGEFDIYNM